MTCCHERGRFLLLLFLLEIKVSSVLHRLGSDHNHHSSTCEWEHRWKQVGFKRFTFMQFFCLFGYGHFQVLGIIRDTAWYKCYSKPFVMWPFSFSVYGVYVWRFVPCPLIPTHKVHVMLVTYRQRMFEGLVVSWTPDVVPTCCAIISHYYPDLNMDTCN